MPGSFARKPEHNLEKTINYGVDTSFLYAELLQQYKLSGEPVDIDFRKLVNWVRLGDQYTHQIHTYPAKLLPNIAHFFVRASAIKPTNKIVLDPFSGSGTVALEASLAGYEPFIADANPLALLISQVKTTAYDCDNLHQTLQKILSRFKRFRKAPEVEVVNENIWYSPTRKKSLEILRRAIMEVECQETKNFFLVGFSAVAKKLSYADPAISVPVRLKIKESFTSATNKKIEKKLQWIQEASTIEEFEKICSSNIQRVHQANLLNPNRRKAIVVGNDARSVERSGEKIPDASVSMIITSPPYGSAQKYIRASSLSLNWLEITKPSDLSALESRSIGREHVPISLNQKISNEFPKEYEALLSSIKNKNPTRERITRYYLNDMADALSETARVLSPGGYAVFVVGNNMVCGHPLRNDKFIQQQFLDLGLKLELKLIDDIKSRGLMTKRNKTASVISREVVLVFRKTP